MHTQDEIVISRADSTLHITFNRPKVLNALNAAMPNEAAQAVEAAVDDPDVRAIVITGAGRAFSSGADLSRRADPEFKGGPSAVDRLNRLVRAIRAVPKPVVAAVNGPAVGAGFSVALAADFIIARQSAYFLLSFAKVGLMPDGGVTALLPPAIGRIRATRMAMLGERIPAQLAADWGLITQVVSDEDFDAEVRRMTARLAGGPTAAFAWTKTALNAATSERLEQAFTVERAGQTELKGTADHAEGIAAFLQKRSSEFSGR